MEKIAKINDLKVNSFAWDCSNFCVVKILEDQQGRLYPVFWDWDCDNIEALPKVVTCED